MIGVENLNEWLPEITCSSTMHGLNTIALAGNVRGCNLVVKLQFDNLRHELIQFSESYISKVQDISKEPNHGELKSMKRDAEIHFVLKYSSDVKIFFSYAETEAGTFERKFFEAVTGRDLEDRIDSFERRFKAILQRNDIADVELAIEVRIEYLEGSIQRLLGKIKRHQKKSDENRYGSREGRYNPVYLADKIFLRFLNKELETAVFIRDNKEEETPNTKKVVSPEKEDFSKYAHIFTNPELCMFILKEWYDYIENKESVTEWGFIWRTMTSKSEKLIRDIKQKVVFELLNDEFDVSIDEFKTPLAKTNRYRIEKYNRIKSDYTDKKSLR
jgi:hypothetical protein